MADVLCPHCGKSNPPDAETCLFCGKPLLPGEATSPADESEDWLSGLRSGDWQIPSEPASEPEEPSPAEEVPDWLARVRARSQEEPTEEPAEPPAGQPEPEEDLDWLKALGGAPEQTEGSADDWLSQGAGEPAVPLGLSGEDWLKGLRGEEPPAEAPEPPAEETEPPAEAAAPEPAADEWLSSLGGWQPPEEPAPSAPEPEPEAAVPDWFAQMPGLPETPAEGEPPLQEGGEAGLPEWLTGFSEETAEKSEPAAEVPEWLKSEAAPAEPEAAAGPSTPEESLPDWLASAAAPAEEPLPEAPAGEDLSFLSQLGAPQEEAPLPEAGAAAFDLSTLFVEETPPAESEEPAAPEPVSQEEPAAELPDFSALASLETAGEEETPAEAPAWMGEESAPAEPAPQAEEVPEWMSSLAEPAGPEPAAEEPPAEEVPGWLKDFSAAGEAPGAEAPVEGAAPFVDEELPAWLDNIQPPAAEAAEAGVSPLLEQPEPAPELSAPFQVELPEWLGSEQEGEAAPPAAEAMPGEEAAAEPAEELARAELPSWVEDLRPLESVIPGEMHADAGETVVEKAGPLAGMRGVLQSEELATRYRKPPVYSARLRVSERQRSQAAILENLIGLETSPKQVSSEPSRAPQIILRVIIALLLILSLLTMLLPDFTLVKPTAVYPPALTALYDRVEALPADAPVLLAFDYEPALAGEMRYAAGAVIEHLMVKNSRMAYISTIPTGPILADDLLAEVHNRRPEYQLVERTVNLGYLPGGTTSLLEFAHNPQGATPSSLDTPLSGIAAWQHSAVLGISSLRDYALVIVLTDSPETGRAWVEQVQPVLGDVPLSMVTSAQAGPMLQPYFDSGQVLGMSVGLQGGALYEQRSGRVNLANRFWGAYQSGSLAGLFLLLIGGIISAVLGLSGRKPTQKGKA